MSSTFPNRKPLSYAISDENPNVELKRWFNYTESFSPIIIYKPGTTTVVADALSRIEINHITEDENDESSDSGTQHSAESSLDNIFLETKKPLNQYKQKHLIAKG